MPRTRREIALGANRASATAARRRRFRRYAEEMAAAPLDVERDVQNRLAEMLADLDWEIHVP